MTEHPTALAQATPVRRALVLNAEFRKLWAGKENLNALALRYGVSVETIRRRAAQWGLPPRPRRRGAPRFTEAERATMRDMRRRGVPVNVIAAETGRSVRWIKEVVRDVVPEGARLRATPPDPVAPEDVPVVAGGDFWCPVRDARVIETQGRYHAVAKLAEFWNIPTTRIVARWHLLRAG